MSGGCRVCRDVKFDIVRNVFEACPYPPVIPPTPIMTEEMPPRNDLKQEREYSSWKEWAGQTFKVKRKMFGATDDANDLVNIFPGWATRRYPADSTSTSSSQVHKPFEMDVFISGFAVTCKSPENASRSQRTLIRLAKAFASLPKLASTTADIPPNTSSLAQLTPSTEELLAKVHHHPLRTHSEITGAFDVETIDAEPLMYERPLPSHSSSIPQPFTPTPEKISDDVIGQLHANLEKRLQPFWSSALPSRIVRLYLFTSPNQIHTFSDDTRTTDEMEESLLLNNEFGPIAYMDVMTKSDGSFRAKFKVKWEDLCQHPSSLHIAFGSPLEEHQVLIIARLLAPSKQSSRLPSSLDTLPPSVSPQSPMFSKQLSSVTRIPITYSPIRVISDIDDTIKLSGILSGARAVFHNVFVKDLRDNVIPGMGEWYSSMWRRGVRFHYVSNGPFELLPVIKEFFQVSQLPPGSLKLRSYAGRSLFNDLLSASATRKRAGVVDVLDSFPDSRFFLIGDSGEQDLELYADLARERPDQILGVFVRDADSNTCGVTAPIIDPTGRNAMRDAGTRRVSRPLLPRSKTGASADSSDKYDYLSSTHPHYVDKTPRSNVFSSLDSGVFSSGGESSSSVVDGFTTPSSTGDDVLHFTNAPISAEPESGDLLPPTLWQSAAQLKLSDSPRPLSPLRSVVALSALRSQSDPSPSFGPSSSVRKPIFSKRFIKSSSLPVYPSSSASSFAKKAVMSDSEKRRNKLQSRVYRARTQMPGHVPLRLFREPGECLEVTQILDREVLSSSLSSS